jgi:hypothetical protein
VKRIVLKSAELRDGRYVEPFALLDVDQLWVGRREVWTSTHGRATRYHVMIDGGVAACRKNQTRWRNRSVILINEDSLIPITSVPAHMCCLRNGCRQIFEAMIQ